MLRERPGLELHQHLSAEVHRGRFIGEKPSSASSDSLTVTATSLASPLGYRGLGRERMPRAGLEPAHLGTPVESHAEPELALCPFGHRRPGNRTPGAGPCRTGRGTTRLPSKQSYIQQESIAIPADP